eukprot:s357_g32.t1
MQTFALGERCIKQRRGSPMGSPLSPALCLMVVSISEEVWHCNFREILSNHHLFTRHIRYVDNRLLVGDPNLVDLPPYETLLDEGFYGRPVLLETEPDQEFLGFMIATEPFELIYRGPTDISQVLSPFSASPPKVLLSGFRSRCHIVAKGAHPLHRVHAGIQQLIDLYTLAGFEATDLNRISSPDRGLERVKSSCPTSLNHVTCSIVLGLCISVFLHSPSFLSGPLPFWFFFRFFTGFPCDFSCHVLTCLSLMHGSFQAQARFFFASHSLPCHVISMDSRAAMTYHLGNALLHLQYLAGHMPWFVPPADLGHPPATMPFSHSSGLTSFVPHPGRMPPPASSSRPASELTLVTHTIDGHTHSFIGPPPEVFSPAHPGPASTRSSRHAPRGPSDHCIHSAPDSRHYPLSPSDPSPVITPSIPVTSTNAVSTPAPASSTPHSADPSRPRSPVDPALDRKAKRRRTASVPASFGLPTEMPPPATPVPAPVTSAPSAPSTGPASTPVLPVPESPPPEPLADPGATSDSDDSHLPTCPASPGTKLGPTTGPSSANLPTV